MKTCTHFARLMKDRAGNFGIMTAIAIPVLMGAAGVAIDLTRVIEEKNHLQAAADAATLAAASAMSEEGTMSETDAEKLMMDFYVAQAAQTINTSDMTEEEKAAAREALRQNAEAAATATIATNTAASYDIRLKATYDVPMSGLTALLGFDKMTISVESQSASGREGNALSMYLALDESGSMAWDTTTVNPAQPTKLVATDQKEKYSCPTKYNPNKMCERTVYKEVPNYLTKMASLKAAAAVMFGELDKADPNMELIRVGADSYDDRTKPEQSIQWGTSYVKTYVNNMPAVPDGGTDASGAMANAFAALKAANGAEKTAHTGKGNTSFERFIVLMTDGEMTGNSGTWNSTIDVKVRALCDQAKADKDQAGNAIKIYTIAFMAPTKGKELLEYCSSGKEDYYYEPNSMTQLVQSFGEIARKAAKTGTRLTN
ncbi:Flp pilus assembly protein TadG [Neorhizobium sp. R1-B]|nr:MULTISPECIES: vWA domain-containing protein [Neorhizobium]TCV66348.1 Flp pilus assembly protein TadG [Neorhizobium sp. S3-V5DH]TDX74588.1 Flp pilus assembly protein TadG [Neorhizobium sp. R1-B]